MPRSLGLDVGSRRIGVAVSDTRKVIARPVEIIDRKHQDALACILQHVLTFQPDEIVIGYPIHADGSMSEQAKTIGRFAERLRTKVVIPVILVDERYSTAEAREILTTRKRKDQTQLDDAIAAAVILQRYLEEHYTHLSASIDSTNPDSIEE